MMSPINLRVATQQEAYAALQYEEQMQANSACRPQKTKDNEESEESIAWKVRAQQLLEEGRTIYGSDEATQCVFRVLVSHGEEARRKRLAEIETSRIRRYSKMSSTEMWVWSAFRGLYLYAVFGLLLWLGLIIAGTPVWAATLAGALFVAFLIVQRKRWMCNYAAQNTTQSI